MNRRAQKIPSLRLTKYELNSFSMYNWLGQLVPPHSMNVKVLVDYICHAMILYCIGDRNFCYTVLCLGVRLRNPVYLETFKLLSHNASPQEVNSIPASTLSKIATCFQDILFVINEG